MAPSSTSMAWSLRLSVPAISSAAIPISTLTGRQIYASCLHLSRSRAELLLPSPLPSATLVNVLTLSICLVMHRRCKWSSPSRISSSLSNELPKTNPHATKHTRRSIAYEPNWYSHWGAIFCLTFIYIIAIIHHRRVHTVCRQNPKHLVYKTIHLIESIWSQHPTWTSNDNQPASNNKILHLI